MAFLVGYLSNLPESLYLFKTATAKITPFVQQRPMFLPVLADQSGNTGLQTLAVTLRGSSWANCKPAGKKR